jgi:hypothetical protein
MNKKPYIGIIHDGERIVVGIFAFMAASEDEAYLAVAQRIPTSGVDLADVKIAFQEVGNTFSQVPSFVSTEKPIFISTTTENGNYRNPDN